MQGRYIMTKGSIRKEYIIIMSKKRAPQYVEQKLTIEASNRQFDDNIWRH